ncbi:hypothetical protein NGRA_2674 [Nosema granulosis]|uniref:Uncharacterized protein n=1 Tax=Nosema granulosis TaxID=83296 RepID=A0A9P6GW67_9MICR|nr:hypothetical protein NGRA_2674 [Nosema granulosis]
MENGLDTIKPCTSIKEALDFEIIHLKDGLVNIKLTSEKDKFIDLANGINLLLFPYNDGKYRTFTLSMTDHNRVAFVLNNKCIEYDDTTQTYRYKDCTYASNQIFAIIDGNHEKPEPSTEKRNTEKIHSSKIPNSFYGTPLETHIHAHLRTKESDSSSDGDSDSDFEISTTRRSKKGIHGRKHCHLKCY